MNQIQEQIGSPNPERDYFKAELKRLKESFSWKITRPLRLLSAERAETPQPPIIAEVPGVPAELPGAKQDVLELYVKAAPHGQNVIDIFKGEWSSSIPGFNAGTITLFHDHRINWFGEQLGGFRDKAILELGPLEGGHTSMMARSGARSIVAIEANTRAYLKCLVTKELLGYKASFLLGNFVRFLESTEAKRYDFVLASGVLYHMVEPQRLLQLVTNVTDTLGLWTHYYDPEVVRRRDDWKEKFDTEPVTVTCGEVKVELYRQQYLSALGWGGFCGGAEPISYWMKFDDIIRVLDHLGFKTTVGERDLDHPNGPCTTLFARRR